MPEKEPLPKLDSVLDTCETESSIESCTVDINSDTAETMLKFNTTNRPLSPSQIKLYANEMLRGKWKLNGEPIIFGVNSKGEESIISGQHRLHALILANKINEANPDKYPEATTTIHTVVITGVEIEVADTNDQGMTRKHAHVLFRDEWVSKNIPAEWSSSVAKKAKWCNTLAGAARLVWLRAGGATVSSAPKFLVSEMLDFIKEDHKGICEFVSAVLSSSTEDAAGLKISIPYIAALCYLASLDEDGKVHKSTKDLVLDAILNVAQNTVTPGTAEHALASYWNKLFSTPGSKDRDLDHIGPFVKALNAIIAGEKITAGKLALTAKEKENYKTHPPLLTGFDEACFIYAAELKSKQATEAEEAKTKKLEAREAAKEAKEKAALDKAEEKAKAAKEVEDAKANVPVKTGVMAELAKTTKKPITTTSKKPLADMPTKPIIKRKPVPAGSK